jgi:putative transposase
MTERKDFIEIALTKQIPFTRLCALYGISERVGYKWLNRYRNEGEPGLRDRPHIAISRPHTTPAEIAEAVVQAKKMYPFWGPKKLLALLRGGQHEVQWPAVSTAHGILARAGQLQAKRSRAAGRMVSRRHRQVRQTNCGSPVTKATLSRSTGAASR